MSPPLSLTKDEAGALYNYMLVGHGKDRGTHNPKYAKQLLWDSILLLKGSNPAFITTRP